MAQITTGIRSIFSNPTVYSLFQNLMGARKFRVGFIDEFVRPFPGSALLDIGCGPADILEFLPKVDYWGFDISESYINQATIRFGAKGHFQCKLLQEADLAQMPAFDIVLLMGVLHHLDDQTATDVLNLANKALKPGGRLLTFDPCFEPGQSPIARFLINHDRGQNVRSQQGYTKLAEQVFKSPKVIVRHQSWVPYTHCFMECTRT
ncbi:MAG: class I SAM-dependent methyltransferase [Betaproteobacteria bacterium HGW-Betaproteobacteria-1]|jgi:SAM-dependent methyltransferase|nr:MAG: class I SAM-dependent methyltransferase [Betaproteobacteria bacterium HGW-Betaproteobacteria-1]